MNNRSSIRRLRRQRIKKHIHKHIQGTSECPRLTVYRSLKAIYAQVVDDTTHRTLCSVSSLSKELRGEVQKAKNNIEVGRIVGKTMGEEVKKRNIERVVFDRNGYLYHGRVKAVADGAREAGLKF
ncbi:MAG: 50S ribosomal protein L18 [bacterium]